MISKAAQYRSYYEVAKKIKNPEARLAFYDALDAYRFEGIEPEDLPIEADIAFTAIKANIDADLKRKTGGAPLGNQNAKKQPAGTIKNNPKQPVDLKETNNEDVDVEDNEEVDAHTEEKPEYIKRLEKRVCAGSRNNGQITKDLFNIVTAHNSTAARGRTIAIPKDEWTFSNKNMRELLAEIGTEEPAERILAAIANFTKVARRDTWQKSFTWAMFCKHYNDYTPEFFTLERYLNAEPQTDDASKKPENVFFFAHKDDPRFHVETFQNHIEDWKAEGRPEGAEYYRLQSEWEARKCS